MQGWLQDFRLALRRIAKAPGPSTIIILTLGLGIGASTAILSLFEQILLRPLPFPESERIVSLWEVQLSNNSQRIKTSLPNFLDWANQGQKTFESLAAYQDGLGFNMTQEEGPERVPGAAVTSSFFSVLGVEPIRGRTLLPSEGKDGEAVVVLSHDLWLRHFGGDPGLVGRAVPVNGRNHLVVGIMPPDFHFPGKSMLWTPLPPDRWTRPRTSHFLKVLGRLRPGVSVVQARSRMNGIASRLAEQYPDSNKVYGISLLPLHQDLVGEVRPALLALLGAVGLVLLIACANVANLELARSGARRTEIAVRVALGASRLRVVRQCLAESLLLAAGGGIVGLCLAAGALKGLSARSPVELPQQENIGLDIRVLGINLTLVLFTGLLFGLFPALRMSRPSFESLRSGRHGDSDGRSNKLLRSGLIVAEMALALILLTGAGLLIRSFASLTQVDPGFRPHNALIFRLSLPATKYAEQYQVAAFCERLIERLAGLPQVKHAATTNSLPLAGETGGTNFLPEGQTLPLPEQPLTTYVLVSPGYFDALGAPLLEGRDFSLQDREDSAPVVIINRALARRYWPDRAVVGHHITSGLGDKPLEIVGVVQNIQEEGLEIEQRPAIYLPISQGPISRSIVVVVRTFGPAPALAGRIRKEVLAIDPEQPVYGLQTLDDHLEEVLARRRFSMLLITVFAAVALCLAALGIYGVMAYSVSQRIREIGTRMALGAKPSGITVLILRHGLGLAALGALAGLVVALGLSRVISGLLFGVGETDLTIFTSVFALLLMVGLLATYLPARRAALTSPAVVLKGD